MKFNRLFTVSKQDLSTTDFEKRTSVIREPDGKMVFEMKDILIPKHWSQVATDILAQKYFRKAGVPKHLRKIYEEGVPEWLQRSEPDLEITNNIFEKDFYTYENDSRQVFHRLSGCWTYWGWKHKYFDTEADAKT